MDFEKQKRDATFWQQFKATVIRNILRKKRGLRHTLREFLAPLYFLLIIVVLKLIIKENFYPEETSPKPGDSAYSPYPFILDNKTKIFVVPDDSETKDFINNIALNATFLTFEFKKDPSDLDNIYTNNPDSVHLALVFHEESPKSKLNYSIRTTSRNYTFALPPSDQPFSGKISCRKELDDVMPKSDSKDLFGGVVKYLQKILGYSMTSQSGENDNERSTIVQTLRPPAQCPVTTYFWSGFAPLQTIVDQAWLTTKVKGHLPPIIRLEMLPKRTVSGDSLMTLRSIIPLYLVICMSQFVTPMLMVVVDEKEKKIKESMKMVGLRDSVFWLSWFLVYSVMVLMIALIASVLVFFVVLRGTNYPVLFVLMLEYGLSMIMFAFMLTALLSKAKPAGIVGGLSTLLLACLYYLEIYLVGSPEYVFWLLSLLSPTAFAMALDKMILFDAENLPFDLWDSKGTIPIAGVMIMIAVDIFLYGFIAAYLDNVVPTEYGTRRKPWFCFQPSYWVKKTRNPRYSRSLFEMRLENDPDESQFSGHDVEPVPASMRGKESIVIDNLKKTFKSFGKPPIEAVKGVSLKIYPGEITAILGHNGAGKTTLFNMLTGMTSVTSGKADIFGYDVSDANEMEEIRKMTGICPQHDVLFDELTAREHLQFFARIRGLSEEEIGPEVESILRDIDLTEKGDAVAEHLSGGQKRKLSVGIALIGDPKIIFLDEPTAGVDPFSRRHMWSILKQRKEGKVILLTTHFMDEADILADRKAIVSSGAVRCYGSSLFLKNKFGVGYHLTMVLNSNGDLSAIRNMISSHVPKASQTRLFGRELSYVLPRDDVDKFPSLFSKIEREISAKGPLGINSYGVSMTTLEEIFLHLGEEEEAAKDAQESVAESKKNKHGHDDEERSQQQTTNNEPLNMTAAVLSERHEKDLSGFSFEAVETKKSAWQMFKALVYVRAVRKYREPVSVIVTIILPLLYVCLGIYLTDLQENTIVNNVPYEISPAMYEKTDALQRVYTWVNRTETSLDNYLEGINTTMMGFPPETSFAQLLEGHQMANLDFKAVQNPALPGFVNMTGYFNYTAQHSIPILINTISNMYTHLYNLPEIQLKSQPFPFTKVAEDFDFASFGGSMFVGFTYVIIPISLALELIEDREIRAKNQLRVNGLGFGLYYSSFFTVLGGMMLFVCVALLALIQIFDLTPLAITPAFCTLIILYLMFTPAALLFAATVSYLFDKVENGQFLFPIASYLGFLPYIAVTVLDMLAVFDGNGGKICHMIFAFVSPLYIPFGIVYFINRYYLTSLCLITKSCNDLTMADYWSQYEIWAMSVACVFHIIVWYVLLRVADVVKDGGSVKNGFKSLMFWKSSEEIYTKIEENDVNRDFIEDEDDDVKTERDEIGDYLAQGESNDGSRVVAVQGLRKVYKTNEAKKSKRKCKCGDVEDDSQNEKLKVAVRNLTLGVSQGETFGLLGHNGAGKTTTMRIVTAEEAPTCGKVQIGSYNIRSNASPGFEMLGYCPQFDAVWRTITIQEHLEIYAAIRGVPPKDISRLAKQFMDGLRIREHAKKYAKDCSGGTKRKLSYAMSMLGDPKIVLLDEPSTGMDPQSKRFVWDTIMASFKRDRGAILTTHSMEEADALCTRVGIMVKGELRCLGSTQHLKNKYGGGYMLEIKLKAQAAETEYLQTQNWEVIEAKVKEEFPGTELQESFADRRTYTIAQSSVASLAVAFKALEAMKSQYDVEEYSFGQTTLEQVFIEFAKQQEEADRQEEAGEAVRMNRNFGRQASVTSDESEHNQRL